MAPSSSISMGTTDLGEESDDGAYSTAASSNATGAGSSASSFLIRRRQRKMMRQMRRSGAASPAQSADQSDTEASTTSSRRRGLGGNFRKTKTKSLQPHHEEDNQEQQGEARPPPPRNSLRPEKKSFLSRRRNRPKKNSKNQSKDPKPDKHSSTNNKNKEDPETPSKSNKNNRRASFFRKPTLSWSSKPLVDEGGNDAYKSEAETEYSSSPNSVAPNKSATPKGGELSFRLAVGEEDDEDKDPVLRLFEDRTTQRVRFALVDHNETDRDVSPPKPRQRGGGGDDEVDEEDNGSGNSNNNNNNNNDTDENNNNSNNSSSPGRSFSLKRFMKGALFGGKRDKDEVDAEVKREIEQVKHEIVWESTETDTGGEIVVTQHNGNNDLNKSSSSNIVTFQEDPQTRKEVIKLLNKARRAQYVHFRYEYAVKCYLKALDLLKQAEYPEDHPVALRTFVALNHAHTVLDSYKNSAHIVKMGMKYEDAGEWVRALKMYTIAYRIRSEVLGRGHPSLVVLLNLLGNIQIQRGELEEAMQIYELALKDEDEHDPSSSPTTSVDDNDSVEGAKASNTPNRALLARSVTYRDMGIIYEKWGDHEQALSMYHKSLDFLAEYKQINFRVHSSSATFEVDFPSLNPPPVSSVTVGEQQVLETASSIGMESAMDFPSRTTATANATGGDDGMEVLVGRSSEQDDLYRGKRKKESKSKSVTIFQASSDYDVFFPPELDEEMRRQRQAQDKKSKESRRQQSHQQNGDYADVDAALTLHQIAQLHRSQGEYNLALSAFTVSLRGMKYCVGRNHPNVAAILGNMGNLQKEMGDMDASFATYQQVLGIESYRLGLSHPDVAVTLHNIATIDAARGNHEHALALYRQVIALQRNLFGVNHVAVAVTCACMGDVYERVGDLHESIGCFEEAVRIKTIAMGRHSLEVARLLHKLGKLAICQCDFPLADSYVSRAILIYRLNKLSELDEWMVDAARDGADIDAAIAMNANLSSQNSFDHFYGGDSDYRLG